MSALPLPISAFSKAFDCKGEEGSEGKRRSRAATNTTQGGPKGEKKVKSEE